MEPFAINYREEVQISQVDCGLMANFTVWIEKGYKHTGIRYLHGFMMWKVPFQFPMHTDILINKYENTKEILRDEEIKKMLSVVSIQNFCFKIDRYI